MSAHFQNALKHLQEMLKTMATMTEESLKLSGKAVATCSTSDAARVIAGDEHIDAMEVQIEEECLKILALHQPVASDLRLVITILKVNNELERIGDLAVNMAERVESLETFKDYAIEKFDFSKMLQLACLMLKESLNALKYHNVALAKEVIERDREVDNIHRNNYKVVRSFISAYPDCTQYYLNGLTFSRCIERIADSATNIAEDVIYLEHGKIIRHYNPSRPL